MRIKPLIIVAGEPYSIFSEIFLKIYKKKIKKIKSPIVLVASKKLFEKQMNKPITVGITGGSGSGKTLFLKQLMQAFKSHEVSLLSLDNYYRPRNEQPKDDQGIENFDLPESLDRIRFSEDLKKLKQNLFFYSTIN